MKHKNKFLASVLASFLLTSMIVGCYNPVASVKTGKSEVITPIDNFETKETKQYNEEGETAEVLNEIITADGICSIKVTEAYFDVTLDEEKATPFEAGKAYGEAINMIFPEFGSKYPRSIS